MRIHEFYDKVIDWAITLIWWALTAVCLYFYYWS